MRLGVLLHLFDFFFGKTGRRRDVNLLLLARPQILRGHMDDAVRIDVKGNLNLRHASRSRRDVGELKATERLIVRCHRALALQDVNVDRGLVIGRRGENLRLLRRNRRISLDHRREDAAQRLDTQRQRRDVEKEDVLHLALQNAGLNRGADRDGFIRIDALARFFAEFSFNHFLHGRDTGRAADEQNLFDVGCGNARVFHRGVNRRDRRFHEIFRNAIKFRARQIRDEMHRLAFAVHRDKGQIDFRRHNARKLDLRLFTRFFETLIRHRVAFQSKPVLFLERIGNPIHDARIEIIAAQMPVSVRSLDFKDAIRQIQNGHIEGAAAQIVDEEEMFLVVFHFIEAVGEGRGRRFIDDAEDIQPRNLARVLRRLALAVREIRRAGDDGFRHFFTQIRFRIRLEFLQNHRGNFLRRVALAVDIHFVIAAHVALDGNDGALRIGNRLALGQLPHKALARFGKPDDGRRETRPFRIRNDDGLAAFHDCYDRIGGPQINPNDF